MHCPNRMNSTPDHDTTICVAGVGSVWLFYACCSNMYLNIFLLISMPYIFKIFRLKTWFVYFHFWFFIYKNAVCGWLLHLCILFVFCYAICPPRGKFSESWGSNINIQLQGGGNTNSNGNMAYQLQKIETCSRKKNKLHFVIFKYHTFKCVYSFFKFY